MDAVKTCTRCRQTKPLTEFHRDRHAADGHRFVCANCGRAQALAYRNAHIEKYRAYSRIYDATHRARIYQQTLVWAREKRKKERAANSEWYQRHLAKQREYDRQWHALHPERVRAKVRRAHVRLRQRCPWVIIWRNSLKNALYRLGIKKQNRMFQLLGYRAEDLKKHLEARFQPGMSWSNWGEWHVDHVRPVNTFPSGTLPSEVNALSNLRPLWAVENIRRRRTLDVGVA
jgi:hypothetical protein